eukprot:gene2554-4987_t
MIRVVSLHKKIVLLSSVRALTFVSKHFQVDPNEIRQLIKVDMGTEMRILEDGSAEAKVCNLCPKKNKTNDDNIWKLRIHNDGSYHCFRCSVHGGWFQLKEKVRNARMQLPVTAKDILRVDSTNTTTSNTSTSTQIINIPIEQDVLYEYSKKFQKKSTETKKVLNYLKKERGLSEAVLHRYGVGWSTQKYQNEANEWIPELCVTFPWMIPKENNNNDNNNNDSINKENELITTDIIESEQILSGPALQLQYDIIRVKHRAIATKGKQRLLPKGGMWGFFGWHMVEPHHQEIVITEGEYDAMAVYQVLSSLPIGHQLRDIPVISLPNGCNSLPSEILIDLERFGKIYVWMDDDDAGRTGCEKFVKKMGSKRCVIVKPLTTNNKTDKSPKDANDAMRQGVDMIAMLEQAQCLPHKSLQTFNDLRAEILQLIRSPQSQMGSIVPSFKRFNTISGGFRKGELIILTGNTGSGKTTLLSQISLDFAQQGRPVLWGSFEIPNKALILKMLQQYVKINLLSLKPVELERYADEFQELPLVFLKFYGGTEIDQ